MITEKSLEDILRPLIEVDTSNPPGNNYRKICEIIKDQLEPIGCDIRLISAPKESMDELHKETEGLSGERVNLVATLKRGTGKVLVLNGHIDVVPATGNWMYPPFELTDKDEYWYGRGVADMKGALAGLIKVIQTLSTDQNWSGTIKLEAVCDEEIGGNTGTAFLHDSGIVTGDYFIVGDGSIEQITNAANGRLNIRVLLKGKSIHSSMNWRGINAIDKAGRLVNELERYNKILYNRKSNVPTNPKTGVDSVISSVTVGTIRGGTKVNIVPDQCILEIDRRVNPDETKKKAILEFKQILEKLKSSDKDFDYELTIGGLHDSFKIPESLEPIPSLREAYQQVTGEVCPIYGTLGCIDASYITKHTTNVAALGAFRVDSNVHGINERVRRIDVVNFTKIIKNTALKLLKT